MPVGDDALRERVRVEFDDELSGRSCMKCKNCGVEKGDAFRVCPDCLFSNETPHPSSFPAAAPVDPMMRMVGMPITPGQTLQVQVGGPGEASSIQDEVGRVLAHFPERPDTTEDLGDSASSAALPVAKPSDLAPLPWRVHGDPLAKEFNVTADNGALVAVCFGPENGRDHAVRICQAVNRAGPKVCAHCGAPPPASAATKPSSRRPMRAIRAARMATKTAIANPSRRR